MAGVGVKAMPSGTTTYIVKYRAGGGGRAAVQRWLTIGRHGPLTCEEARDLAQKALATVAAGRDPQALKQPERDAPTMTELWRRYEEQKLPLRSDSTRRDYRQRWRDIIGPALGRKKVRSVVHADITRIHRQLQATPYQANRCVAQLSKLFNLAETWGLRDPGTNPCRLVEKHKEKPRNRYLSGDEIKRLGRALDDLQAEGGILHQAAQAIRLLLLTGDA